MVAAGRWPDAAASIAARAALAPSGAPRREDPCRSRRPGGRAQAGDGAVRRRDGLDGARRAKRPRGVAADHGSLLLRSSARACTASRARSTSSRATGSWPLFGAPIAHEDHARRACYAALHLQRELAAYAAELRRAEGSASRSGWASTPARWWSARSARTSGMEYTAIGHTVGLAQRMEQLAEPGKVYLTAAHGVARRRATSRSPISASSRSRARAGRCGSTS